MTKALEPSKPVTLTTEQSGQVKRIKSYHKGFQKAFGDQMGFAFLAGVELNRLKEALPHGKFDAVRLKYFPDINERSAQRYALFATSLQKQIPAPGKSDTVSDLKPLQITNGKLTKEEKNTVLKAVHNFADGKSLTEMYRDLGVIKQPQKDGGFRPNADAVEAWLAKHHPELKGTKFNDLPKAIQAAFKKQYKPNIDSAGKEALDGEAWDAAVAIIGEKFDKKIYALRDKATLQEQLLLFRNICQAIEKIVEPKGKKP